MYRRYINTIIIIIIIIIILLCLKRHRSLLINGRERGAQWVNVNIHDMLLMLCQNIYYMILS
jgi:hypothetical protein